MSRLYDGGHAPTHTKENVTHGQGQVWAAGEDTKFRSLCDKLYNEPLWPMKRRNENRQPGFQAGSWGEMLSHCPSLTRTGGHREAPPPTHESPAASRTFQSQKHPLHWVFKINLYEQASFLLMKATCAHY